MTQNAPTRLLAKRENHFGRSGTLRGRRVVMLWGDPPGWEAMLVAVLGHLGVGREDDVVVVVGDARQFWARDFFGASETAPTPPAATPAWRAASTARAGTGRPSRCAARPSA